jgi:hypothetical protein
LVQEKPHYNYDIKNCRKIQSYQTWNYKICFNQIKKIYRVT